MNSITIIIGFGSHQRTFQFEVGGPVHGPRTVIIEQVKRFLPPHLGAEDYDIRILSLETPNAEVADGIRISKLVDEGQVDAKLLAPDGRQLDADRELLDQLVLIPLGAEPAGKKIAHGTKEDARRPAAQSAAVEQGTGVDRQMKLLARPGPRELALGATSVKIKVWQGALRKAREHAQRHRRDEVGGICIGTLGKGRHSGRWIVEITDTLMAEHTINRGASITFTPDTWSAANRIIEQRYATSGERMVGWYHSHPMSGVFFSFYDLFVHENFFTQPWHVALVIDPFRGREGFFVWSGEATSVRRYPDDEVEILSGSCPRPAAEHDKRDLEQGDDRPAESHTQQTQAVPQQDRTSECASEEGRSKELRSEEETCSHRRMIDEVQEE